MCAGLMAGITHRLAADSDPSWRSLVVAPADPVGLAPAASAGQPPHRVPPRVTVPKLRPPAGGGYLLFWLPGIVVPVAFAVAAAVAPEPPQRPALSLLQAVRTTLAHDPNIQLQQEEIHASRGSVQEAKGRFDTRLSSSLSQGLEQTAVQISATNALNP